MSDYELQRDENIAKNNAKLLELGIQAHIQAVNAKTALTSSRPERRVPKSALPDDVIPSRITRSATAKPMTETEAALPAAGRNKTTWSYQLATSLR